MKPLPPGAPPKCLCSFLTSWGETHVSQEHPHMLFTSCSSFLSYRPFQCQLGCLLGDLHEFLSFSLLPSTIRSWATHQTLTCHPVRCPEFLSSDWEAPGSVLSALGALPVLRCKGSWTLWPQSWRRAWERRPPPTPLARELLGSLVNRPLLTVLCSPVGWEDEPHMVTVPGLRALPPPCLG